MGTVLQRARGISLVLFICLAACTWTDSDTPNTSHSSLRSSQQAMRVGDYNALRVATNKVSADNNFYADLHGRYDPEAFVLAAAVGSRQFDLLKITASLGESDRISPKFSYLGFTEQALRTDILNATKTSYTLRTGGKKYYREMAAPIKQVPTGWPDLPEGVVARQVSFSNLAGPRVVTVTFTQSTRGVESLQAHLDLSKQAPVTLGGDEGLAESIQLVGLNPIGEFVSMPFLLKITELRVDGKIISGEFERGDNSWLIVNSSARTMLQRLETIRDRRLKFLAQQACQFEKVSGRKASKLVDFQKISRDVIDPVSGPGQRNWASWMPLKAYHFRISSDCGYLVECISPARDGKIRAITPEGKLVWK